ncbi:MAG: arsenite methyltransferase [Anaerolineales bacterium]|nr:MAG: arsenite methyltransferase [Anaerolineales bacterium]
MSAVASDETIKKAVRDTYGGIARRFVDNGGCGGKAHAGCGCGTQPTSCCGSSAETARDTGVAAGLYAAEALAGLPDGAPGASLGCGDPTAIASLKPGDVVLDLGAGGGIDCFLAANKVGPEGRVIGLDMTPEMIKLARRNAKEMGLTNVDFRFGEMEDIPLPDESVDVIISNCVINLSPDKDAVFSEAFRVLRPGGRMSVSDIVVDGQLPEAVQESLAAWCGCISGGLEEAEYLARIRAAGFDDVEIVSRNQATTALDDGVESQGMTLGGDGRAIRRQDVEALLDGSGVTLQEAAGMVVSIKVRASKPA